MAVRDRQAGRQEGVFAVVEAERQDFYIINRRNTLENPASHLRALENSRGKRAKRFLIRAID
ncbi:hypothetical protein E2C01_090984 [Portunus trituberculatus]|uniref:Uncharacterized protein n=1 Tax=Portunus trituberculatus TaxID=210409 RepID=A0A5B7JRT1_PORTR|nr:hypothetical protein [Portunus trituberculatus]